MGDVGVERVEGVEGVEGGDDEGDGEGRKGKPFLAVLYAPSSSC